MRIHGIKRITGIAIVAGLAVAMAGTDAVAWSYGSWGSWGSHGSAASYGSYGSYGRVGLFGRIRPRRAFRRMAYRTYYGSYGSYASYGSYGSYGSHGSYGGYYRSTTPTVPSETPTVPSESASVSPRTGSGTIKVRLPDNAKVFVNDSPTTSTGSERSYVSLGLREGMTYSYMIRVKYEDAGGEAVVENKLVKLNAGEVVSLEFGQGAEEATATAAAPEPVKTRLKVEVPEDSKVFMAGVPTKQTGELRTFSTTELASGEVWDGYVVRVELDRDGQTMVREQELKIRGGETYELAFSFDSPATAQLAQLGK